jgi:hypothetical protein
MTVHHYNFHNNHNYPFVIIMIIINCQFPYVGVDSPSIASSDNYVFTFCSLAAVASYFMLAYEYLSIIFTFVM